MTVYRQYPPSGVLFQREKRTPKTPDMAGNLEITPEVLRDLVDRANRGEKIVMSLIAYKNSHPTKGEYLRLTAAIDRPYVPNQQGGYRNNGPQRQQQPVQQQFAIGGGSNNSTDPDDDVPF